MWLRILLTVVLCSAPALADDPPAPPKKTAPKSDWRLAATLTGPTKPVTAVTVGKDWVAAGTENGELKFWDLKTGEPRPLLVPASKGEPIRELRTGPDGQSLYAIEGKNTIARYRIQGQKVEVNRIELAGRVMSGGPDFKMWAVDAGETVDVVKADLAATPVEVSRQGAFRHSAFVKRELAGILRDETTHIGPHLSVALIPPDQKGLLTAAPDIGAAFFDKPNNLWYAMTGYSWLQSAQFTPDSRYLIISSYRVDPDRVALGPTGAPILPSREKNGGDLTLATRRRDEKRDEISILDHFTGKLLRDISVPRESALVLAVSPNGRLLATGGAEGGVHLWSIADWMELTPEEVLQLFLKRRSEKNYTDTPLAELGGQSDAIRCLTFDPTSKRLISGGDDKTVRVWVRP
jgi:WD40 repeat protein